MSVTAGCDDLEVAYRSSNKTVYSAKYHIVWCPEYRRRVVGGRVEIRLKEIVAGVVAEGGGEVVEVEVTPDHVQLLVEVPRAVWLSRLVQCLNGRCSQLGRAEFAHLRRLSALRSPSWFISTVGGAPLEVVRGCVENQEQAA